jgi:hypothetical protein
MLGRRMNLLLIVLAITARGAAVMVLQSHTVPNSTYEHGTIAENLLAGRGFSTHFLGADGPTSQQAPLYPVVVAAAYAVGGVETPRSLLILELGQALLGGLLVLGVLKLAEEVAPGRRGIALIAGAITAFHPTLVYSATHVQVVPLATTMLVWTFALAYKTGRTGRDRDALLCGIVLALLVLTDPILGLVAFGALGALGVGVRSGRQFLRLAAIFGITSIVGVAPWVARNAAVYGEFVFIKSTFGYAFWQGNCSLSEGTDKVVRPSVETALADHGDGLKGMNESLWKARHEAGYLDDIALSHAEVVALGKLSEPERSRVLFRRALDDLKAAPGRYMSLCLRRLRYFVLFDETNPKTRNAVYRAGHLGLTVVAALGLLVMPGTLRRRLWPTFLTAGLITAFHTLTIVSARFHIPLEPLLALWGSVFVCRLGQVFAALRAAVPPSPIPTRSATAN